jgi:predicted ATP-grasp superfamily ATP-dependent carboligase
MKKGKILILESNRATLTVVSSLSKNGYNAIVGYNQDIIGERFIKFSRYTRETWSHPGFNEEERFTEALLRLLKERHEINYIFPVGDTSSGLLARNYNQINNYCEIIMAKPAAIEICLDKTMTCKYVLEQNIPLPEMGVAHNLVDIDTYIKRIGYPFILKPNNNLFPFYGKKCIICDTPDEYKKYFPEWPENLPELVFQRMVSGFRHDCMFTAIKGKIVCYFEKKILRTDVYDSTGNEVEIVTVKPSERRKKYIELLTLALDYSGIGCVQFLVNQKDDSSCFLEFNPRLDAGNALPYSCGIDFTKQAIDVNRYLRGEIVSLPNYKNDYPTGKRIQWFLADFSGMLLAAKRREISALQGIIWFSRILFALSRSSVHMTWSWKDPLPTLVMYKQEFSKIILKRIGFR